MGEAGGSGREVDLGEDEAKQKRGHKASEPQ
jgi:hypothetical protein